MSTDVKDTIMATLTQRHPVRYDATRVITSHADALAQRAFDRCIDLPSRIPKPRVQGLTFVLDKGMSELYLQDFLEDAGPYIDLVKLGWGTSRLFDAERLRAKIRTLRAHDIRVSPGGTLMELAVVQDCVPAFLQDVAALGFTCVEVSDGTIEMPHAAKLRLIRAALQMGLEVVSEVGKKSPVEDRNLPMGTRIAQAAAELEAGSWKVIVEGRESGNVGVYAGDGTVQEQDVDALVQTIGLDNLIFEAPQKSQQIWFCKQYGNQVNLGNIAPADVIPVETLRTGLRADTLNMFHDIRSAC
jgi:phosphosulfolactate synthase